MTDTICAISTALGVGAISIIRVSGTNAIEIVNKLFKNKNLEKVDSHTVHYGYITDNNEIVDEVLVTIMKSPKTFTTEDIVEINCHGGIATTNKVLELLLLNGCRLAEGGEFTKRAFLNGRIDLTEAEAVEDLIEAKTDKERKLAINSIKGNLSKLIRNLRSLIISLRANIEVNIDYPEYEDEIQITHKLLQEKLNFMKNELTKILKEAENSQLIKKGINIVLVGKPNVGKSSILNHLLETEKAIVTDIAGTTRDIVEGEIILEGIRLNLIDTAGIRETKDIIEQIGVKKSKDAIEHADLIIYVISNDDEETKEDTKFIESLNKEYIILINKTDLKQKTDLSKLDKTKIVMGNTIENNGLQELKNKIIELFNLSKLETDDLTYLSNARQIALIKQALKYTNEALSQVASEIPIDMIAIDIENCWNALGEIIGETYKDELLDELFSNFCLGK